MPDLINGLFETSGALFILLSIIKTLKDKEVKGVSWLHVSFFSGWGIWNLFYYPFLGQWLSFCGGVAIVISNTVWCTLLIYYSLKRKQYA